jgi:hypothetical protein
MNFYRLRRIVALLCLLHVVETVGAKDLSEPRMNLPITGNIKNPSYE